MKHVNTKTEDTSELIQKRGFTGRIIEYGDPILQQHEYPSEKIFLNNCILEICPFRLYSSMPFDKKLPNNFSFLESKNTSNKMQADFRTQ